MVALPHFFHHRPQHAAPTSKVAAWGLSIPQNDRPAYRNVQLTLPSQVACCRPAAACCSWCSTIPVWDVLALGEHNIG